jgi:hypothetical protein
VAIYRYPGIQVYARARLIEAWCFKLHELAFSTQDIDAAVSMNHHSVPFHRARRPDTNFVQRHAVDSPLATLPQIGIALRH